MLWSDPPDGPSEEARRAQQMLRRSGLLLAIAVAVLMVVLTGLSS